MRVEPEVRRHLLHDLIGVPGLDVARAQVPVAREGHRPALGFEAGEFAVLDAVDVEEVGALLGGGLVAAAGLHVGDVPKGLMGGGEGREGREDGQSCELHLGVLENG